MKNHLNKTAFFELIAYSCGIFLYIPAGYWLFENISQSQQLRDSIIILISALIILAYENNFKPSKPLINKYSLGFLAFGYILYSVARYTSIYNSIISVFIILAGLTCALISVGLLFFTKKRYVISAGFAFYIFTLLSFFIKLVDMPLRVLAGYLVSYVLKFFNSSVQLLLVKAQEPQIALQVQGKSYLVATECNGFGLISSCMVLSVLIACFRTNLSVFKRLFIIFVSVIGAYLLNSLRILSIVWVSPMFDNEHYMFIHEFFGYAYFLIGLFFVWVVSRRI